MKILEKTARLQKRGFCKAPKGSRGSVEARLASRFKPHMWNFEKSQNPQFHEWGQISRESAKFFSPRTREFFA
jgi:hypothetical protein